MKHVSISFIGSFLIFGLFLTSCGEAGPTAAPAHPAAPTALPTTTPGRGPAPTGTAASGSPIPDCPEDISTPLLKFPPLRVADFTAIIPLGNLNPPGHVFPTDHLYFALARDSTAANSLTRVSPVFAPAHGWIIEIISSEHLSETPLFTDYGLRFSPCRQFVVTFGHLNSLSKTLLETAGDLTAGRCQVYMAGGKDFRYCANEAAIELQAGEQIGTTGGREGQNALDSGGIDARAQPLAYANPSRVFSSPNGIDRLHIICPVDYFAAGVRAELEARLGGWGTNPRTAPPICGKVMQDLAGTAQGIWYVKGTTQEFPEDPHLALVHDNVDPAVAIFSVGTSIPSLASRPYSFTPRAAGRVNRDFSAIRADDEIYCFDSDRTKNSSIPAGMVVLLQLTGEMTLRIEVQTQSHCGDGPWVFTSAAVEFER